MSRPTSRVWFGKPSASTLNYASSQSSTRPAASTTAKKQPLQHEEPVELAVVFENIASYCAYKPGTGPRLRPITLLPMRDTTAYVRDEFFVPHTISHDGKKRLQYAVGWTDLPAARLVVDAERIFDYVSPAAYEEWCAARAAERDEEERRREEEENVRAVAEAEAREKGIVLQNGSLKDVTPPRRGRKPEPEKKGRKPEPEKKGRKPGPKKKGRKPKGARRADVRTPPPEQPRGEEEEGKKLGGPAKNEPSLSTPSKSRPSLSGPSLSTPSKARLAEFRELEEAELEPETEMEPETELDQEMEMGPEDTNDEDAIFRQLNGDLSVAEELYDSREPSSVPEGLEPPRKKQKTTSPGPRLSRLLPGIETDSSHSTPFDSSRGATSSPALPPLPNPSQTGLQLPASALPSLPPASATRSSTPAAAPRTAANPPRRSQLSVRGPPSSPLPNTSKAQTPTPKAQQPPPPLLNGSTPKPSTSTPRTGFTPLAQSTLPWSLAAKSASNLTPTNPATPKPLDHAPAPAAPPPSTSTPKPSRPSRPQKRPRDYREPDPDRDELNEPVYEVLRLEGLQIRHVRGKPTRFFAVRWKGSWPPGQNPTWEPEHNIPRAMTKRFLLANPTPTRQNSTMDKYFNPGSAWSSSQRKYSSVSEAFEGADGKDGAGGNLEDAVEEEEKRKEVDGADEMLVVTDDPGPPVKPTLSW